MNLKNPLIVQSNNSLLLEVDNPLFSAARDALAVFAHLEKSPEYMHSYSITPLSLWNAAALGISSNVIIEQLTKFSKYPVPQNVNDDIHELMGRFGKLVLETGTHAQELILRSTDKQLLTNLALNPRLRGLIGTPLSDSTAIVHPANRGLIKQTCIQLGYPIFDKAGYVDGDSFSFNLVSTLSDGSDFTIRTYQKNAAEGFVGNPSMPGGSGVVVLPCGSGKTIVGMYAMSLLKRSTLILVTNITAAHQWRREILEKTTINPGDIGEYSGESKEIRPITLATYQILTYRKSKEQDFVHYHLFNSNNWGLIIYDEVHLLPAPVFKLTAELQARRRLGLTATLIREDGHETDVFALIGPKKFDMPWKDLEAQGWIATARCIEIRVDLPDVEKNRYLALPVREQIRCAYENPNKIPVVQRLVSQHKGDQILIIGQYLSQLSAFAEAMKVPIITGATPNTKRDELYAAFRTGAIPVLILSKVGNFAIDLPEANVAIQISGAFGSRQEEAQRLGRILRPKKNGEQAIFYSVVSRETKELDFAMNRQLFLTEQGYCYEIRYEEN